MFEKKADKILISSTDGKIYCTTNCINTWITIYVPKIFIQGVSYDIRRKSRRMA